MAGAHGAAEAATTSVASIRSASQTVPRSLPGKAERSISVSDRRRKHGPENAHAEKDTRCRDNFGHGVARWLDMPGSDGLKELAVNRVENEAQHDRIPLLIRPIRASFRFRVSSSGQENGFVGLAFGFVEQVGTKRLSRGGPDRGAGFRHQSPLPSIVAIPAGQGMVGPEARRSNNREDATMPKAMRVKIFKDTDTSALEARINAWLDHLGTAVRHKIGDGRHGHRREGQ